jgi:RsmE family RNA methyltransferase
MIFHIKDIVGGVLPKTETDHFFSMRVKDGDVVWVTNLRGEKAQVHIEHVEKKQRTIAYSIKRRVGEKHNESKLLFQAIPDKHYLDKLCEIAPLAGITHIFLFESDYTQVGAISLDRLEKILIRSCEQCELNTKPILKLVEKDELLKLLVAHKPVVLDCEEEQRHNAVSPSEFHSVLVGPEGGWSKEEQKMFQGIDLPFQHLGVIILPAWIAGYSWFCRVLK